ncbi:mechanosensitive ion channel family protein [Stakelama sediminis]|uniref:Small-conductance mechanosensitive channel n=1 Tax=Stakelama sediminis TaxID=463200 RepID=A0A840Z0S2_9SPHN|nr:mechanosensitive ion channel family protein [Stakelama sediminis]MBB5719515.1 small-conductance mechanosensitive channel [Stakelama sediminis]
MQVTNNAAKAATPKHHLNTADLNRQFHDGLTQASGWLQEHWLQILIAVVIAAIIVGILHAIRGWAIRLCRKSTDITGWSKILGKTVGKTGNFFIIMVAAKLVSGYADPPEVVAHTITFLFTIAAVFQAAMWAREVILGFVEYRTQVDDFHGETLTSAMGIIRLLVTLALFSIALIVVLDNLGVNVTGVVAGLGVGGIAIGLAAQGIFADLFAALSIIFDKPFRKGDSIAYDGTSGSIEQIGLKSTRVRSFDGDERIISNRNLLDKEISNNTLRNHRRGNFAIGVTYQTDPDMCERIPDMLKEIVEAHGAIFIRSGFTGFGDSSLDFEVIFDTDGPDYATFYAARTAIGIAILKKFNGDGIDIAYPTQTTFTAAPDGRMIYPYPKVQPVVGVDPDHLPEQGN